MALGVGGMLLATIGRAQVTADQTEEPKVITSISGFWNLTGEERTRSHPFRIECDVTYYDPAWKNLWVQDADQGEYVSTGNRKLDFKSGERVIVTGTFEPPNKDISFEHATVVAASPADTPAPRVDGQLMRADIFANRLVSVEAFVVRQIRTDPEHLQLTLTSEGETVFAYVWVDVAKPMPDFHDSTVRIRGVYVPQTGDGRKLTVELRVPSVENVTVINWLGSDPRFKLPSTSIEELVRLPRRTLVKVTGQVKAQELGRYLRIRDGTGQIDLITAQDKPLAIDEHVEAIGYPSIVGTEWKLESAMFRSLVNPMPLQQGAKGSVLRVAAQVLELPREEAAAGRQVQLTGVVTWSDRDGPFMFIQDASGGVCIGRGELTERLRASGRSVEIKGVTTMGPFAPMVIAHEIINLGNQVMPAAREVSLESALTGVEEAQWVEMRGYLRKVEMGTSGTFLDISTSAGSFRAHLPPAQDLSSLEGAVIRLHGVCTAEADDRRRLTGITLLIPSASFVQVEETAPEDLFEQPGRLLANLGQFGTLKSFNRRVKVSGVVLHHTPGNFINIVEGGESLMVMSRQTVPLQVGDRVDAVGFLGRQAGRPVLREAVYLKTGNTAPPDAVTLVNPAEIRAELDGHLVRLKATVIDDSSVGDQLRLTLQSDNTIFEAYVQRAAAPDRIPLLVGSVTRLTGVYEIHYAQDGQAGAFLIRLRSSADIELLARPSALTRGRVLTFAGTLGVGILLFTAWVVALRRRVQQQTTQIRDQLQREARLETELQRATKLESLGILAGGIAHDFNNLLTVMLGNLSLAMMDMKKDAESTNWLREVERAVSRARDLTQQLLTFSKGGAPIRSAIVLADVVREVAQFAASGSNVRCVFNIADDLWPADVDKGQVGQVVQNVVINAMQVMPDGGQIDISLHNETGDPGFGRVLAPGRYLKLTIADQGSGIPPENLGRIFEPYFTTKSTGSGLGLATVYSIVKKHLGHISVDSTVGRGTVFHIWLPAAVLAPVGKTAGVAEVPAGRGRVLFMDDDEEIRRLGAAMLRRLGYEATTVSDGDAAVLEYRNGLKSSSPYDVVILDLTIAGGVGGCEAMERLLQIDPHVKAVVSSGYSNDQVLSNYPEYGFSGIVTKPYETAALATTLNELLQKSRV